LTVSTLVFVPSTSAAAASDASSRLICVYQFWHFSVSAGYKADTSMTEGKGIAPRWSASKPNGTANKQGG
jgi:hypothetical protein